jgi:hypothetical protein
MRPLEEAGHTAVGGGWTYLTNHTHVLVCLAADPTLRLRDVAMRVGITERAVQKIVHDLEEVGVLSRYRHGRRNRYSIHVDRPLRHPIEAHCRVGQLLDSLGVRFSLPEQERSSTPAV